ncbi:MAG: hypothetical protein RL291_283 [Pseudomonadota bacterium]
MIDAMTRLDGSITAGTYWLSWLVMIAASMAMLHVVTKGWCWQEDYGAEGKSARSLAIAIGLSSALFIYPVLAVCLKALNTGRASPLWLVLLLAVTAVQPVTQWFGLNGSFAKPTSLGMALSVLYLLAVIAMGIRL